MKFNRSIWFKLMFICCSNIFFTGCSLLNGEVFFDYDELIHYSNPDVAEEDLMTNDALSPIDSLRRTIILEDEPTSISDPTFLSDLSKVGFKKKTVSPNKFSKINALFVEKPVFESIAYSCIYVYRDVLVFKKKGKTVGLAKVCLGCNAHIIRGTKANTDNFGQNGDYEKLGKILYP